MTQFCKADAARRTAIRRCASSLNVILLFLTGCSALRSDPVPTEKEKVVATAQTAGPGKYHIRESQYVFYSDFPLKPTLPIFKELSDLREQICKELQLPSSNTIIQVFLFEDQERYEKYMRSHYSELPVRRAFFIKQPHNTGGTDDLFVFTFWGDNTRQDLRHELTHGILHSVLKEVPLWLDEGLAEVYELPPENKGINLLHLEQIRKGPFQPDLAKLEQLSEVEHMQRPEYREAWAWAYFMLYGKPASRSVLLNYLQTLRVPNPAGTILPKLKETTQAPDEALVEFLAHLETARDSSALSKKQ